MRCGPGGWKGKMVGRNMGGGRDLNRVASLGGKVRRHGTHPLLALPGRTYPC